MSVQPGLISGTVLDESGNPVQGAVVVVKRQSDNQTFETTTDASGFFEFTNLPGGEYHAMARYDNSVEEFNSLSKPYLTVEGAIRDLQDDFNDNSLDTSKWTKVTPSGGSITETNQQMELRGGGGDDDRPYLQSAERVQDGQNGSDASLTCDLEITNNDQLGLVNLFWDGTTQGSFSLPTNSIAVEISNDSGLEDLTLKKFEGGDVTNVAGVGFTPGTSTRAYDIQFVGDFDSFDVSVSVDGTEELTASGSFAPSADCPYLGFAPRERTGGVNLDNVNLTH